MTSFDRPDAGLLVEHLLPSLLGASHSLSQDVQERALFFGELGTMLETLHGRITIISSPPRVEREDSQYPWLWRYVSHFTVGATSRAVQHAKLWAFHWKVNHEEYLQLHVSSTNLTTSAFKDQVQAGWQVSLLLGAPNSQTIRPTWGKLIPFLDALGASAGEVAATRIGRLVALLDRVECPADVTFVASIPGQKSAASQLQQVNPSELHVLTPTIGEWKHKSLSNWSADVGVSLGKVHLKWISTRHPWAEKKGWAFSDNSNATLEANGVQIECLPNEVHFTEQNRDGDSRWSHAKLYLIRSRYKNRRRLLVTSANWSLSAWGAGKKSPDNFELGVIIETNWTDLEAMGKPFNPPNTVPFCLERTVDDERPPALQWAEANWDGKCITLHARSTDENMPIAAFVTFTGGTEDTISLSDGTATMPWKDPEYTPLIARFTQGAETLQVDVLDLRPPDEFAKSPLPEVDPSIAAALREAFLLQRYGGLAVDPDSIPGLGSEHKPPGLGAPAADYSVQAWLDARAAFHVVDQWQAALSEAQTDPVLLERVRLDGEELRALFAHREGPADALVAEELGWRIKKEEK